MFGYFKVTNKFFELNSFSPIDTKFISDKYQLSTFDSNVTFTSRTIQRYKQLIKTHLGINEYNNDIESKLQQYAIELANNFTHRKKIFFSLIDYSKKMFTNESFWKGFEEFLINNKTEQDLQTFQKLSQNMDDFEISFIEHIKNTSFDRVSKNITDRFTSKILPTETISTINMSANSINQITTSSGQHGTLLDFEIENELQRLLKLQNSSLENNVIEALNNFFNETNKTVKINNQELKVYLTPEREISFKHLSSGERQVIYIFLKVANATKDNALILMDEPEISLHLAWQEKLISEIRKVNDKSQLIIVTHSPAIVMNGWMDSFIDINDIFVGE